MKNEKNLVFDQTESKLKQKKISTNLLKQDDLHDQFYFNNLADQRIFVSNLTATNLIPPLTRIGSDQNSDHNTSSFSLSKRKPVGNLTPTKFEHLTKKEQNSNFPQQTSDSRSNLQVLNSQDLNQQKSLVELNKDQSNSLNSIQSTDISVNSSNSPSNRSSPDLPNQRSHLTTYFNKPSAFNQNFNHNLNGNLNFKQTYSSSNLFDSIQNLDIQKLIYNDKRNHKFCSTSTLPTISSNSVLPKNAKTAGFIVGSGIYGQILVVFCLVLFTAEIRTSLPLHYFEILYFYLYSVSIIFLLYIFCYLLRGVKSIGDLRSRENKFKKEKVLENERSHGSIFLRIGCIFFGLGSMIYNGLEFGSYFEFGSQSPCHSIYLLVNPLLQAIFTFLQMYFIFTYSRLMIRKFKLIARIGFIHLVATNICTWIKILLKETLTTIHFTESSSSHATLEELILPLKNDIKHSSNGTVHMPLNGNLWNISNPCMKDNIMGTILSDVSPYLYPFIVEYSLIAAAFLYVMWGSIGRLTSNLALNHAQNHLHHHSKQLNCPHLNNQMNAPDTGHVHESSTSLNHLNNMDNNVVLQLNSSTNQMETNSSSPTNQTSNTSITPTSTGNVQSTTPPTNRNVLIINSHHQLANSSYVQSNNHQTANTTNGLLDNISIASSRDSFNGKFSGHHSSYQVNSVYNHNNLNMMQSTQSLYSCLGSSKGLFCGFLFVVLSIITLIVFFVLFHHTNYHFIASLINESSHSILLLLSSFSIIIAYFKIRKLRFIFGVNETADSGLRDLLLKVAGFGLFTYSLFGLIAGTLNLNNIQSNDGLQSLAVLITSILSIIQVSLQSLFISDIVCRKRCSSRQPVPQQLITFLMIVNLIFWVLYTFEMQKVEASPVQLKVYGHLTWSLIVRITVPLSIFYRFHSAITFAECHKSILRT